MSAVFTLYMASWNGFSSFARKWLRCEHMPKIGTYAICDVRAPCMCVSPNVRRCTACAVDDVEAHKSDRAEININRDFACDRRSGNHIKTHCSRNPENWIFSAMCLLLQLPQPIASEWIPFAVRIVLQPIHTFSLIQIRQLYSHVSLSLSLFLSSSFRLQCRPACRSITVRTKMARRSTHGQRLAANRFSHWRKPSNKPNIWLDQNERSLRTH